jgi:hypothetical protein
VRNATHDTDLGEQIAQSGDRAVHLLFAVPGCREDRALGVAGLDQREGADAAGLFEDGLSHAAGGRHHVVALQIGDGTGEHLSRLGLCGAAFMSGHFTSYSVCRIVARVSPFARK